MKMNDATSNFLLNLGANANNAGFQCAIDAMQIIEDAGGRVNFDVIPMYEQIAALNNSTKSRVERNIRHMITDIKNNGNAELLEQMFPCRRMTNSHFLAVMYIKIKQEVSSIENAD